jgi:hypothetical protein
MSRVQANEPIASVPEDGSLGEIRRVRLADLLIDESYQRPLKAHHKRIGRRFNPAACAPLLVGERPDGSLNVIDGQQRRAALMAAGIEEWEAKVVKTAGAEHEARLFGIVNGAEGTVQKLTMREMHRAAVKANDPTALAIERAVSAAGMRVASNCGSAKFGHVSCIGLLRRLHANYGEQAVTDGLKLLARTWPESDLAMRDLFVFACVAVIGNHPGIDRERFVRVLATTPATAILQESVAAGGDLRLHKAYSAVVRRYNVRLRLKLAESLVG